MLHWLFECYDKQSGELMFTVPVSANSEEVAIRVAENFLENVKGVPSIDYRIVPRRMFQGSIQYLKHVPYQKEEGSKNGY